jgi:hypothetical protein
MSLEVVNKSSSKSSGKSLIIIDIFDKIYKYKPRLEKNLNNKIIKEEHLIDCNNNASIIEESIIDYKMTPNSCFLQHLYNNIKNFYSEENNKPILETYTKSFYQQKYNIQLYLIFDTLAPNNNSLVEELCIKKTNQDLDKIIGTYQIENYSETLCFAVSSFLKDIHSYLYTLFDGIDITDSDIEKYIILDNSLTTEIEINGSIIPIFEIDTYSEPRNKQKTIKERNKKEYFEKKEILPRNSVNSELLSAATNSWSNYVLENRIVSKISKSLDSTIGTDLSKYTSFDAMLENYRLYIKEIGGSRKLDVFVNLCTFLNYSPARKDIDGITQQMSYLTRRLNDQDSLLKHLNMLKEYKSELSYKNLSNILEKGISFYIKADKVSGNNCMSNAANAENAANAKKQRIVLFLSNTFFNQLANNPKDSENINTVEKESEIEDQKVDDFLFPTDTIESFCLFLKESKDIKSYSNFSEYEKALKDANSYLNIEKADRNLILYGNYKFKIIFDSLKRLLIDKKKLFDHKVDAIFIQTKSYYSIPNNVCDKAFKIRQKSMDCPGWDQSEQIEKDIRRHIKYSGTIEYSSNELFTSDNDILTKYTDCNPLVEFIATRIANIISGNHILFNLLPDLATRIQVELLEISYRALEDFSKDGEVEYFNKIHDFNTISLYYEYNRSQKREDKEKLAKLIENNRNIQWLKDYIALRKRIEAMNMRNLSEEQRNEIKTENGIFESSPFYKNFKKLEETQNNMLRSITKILIEKKVSDLYMGVNGRILFLYTKRAIKASFSTISNIFEFIGGYNLASLLKRSFNDILGTNTTVLSLRTGGEKIYLMNAVSDLLSALDRFKTDLENEDKLALDTIVAEIVNEKINNNDSIDSMSGIELLYYFSTDIMLDIRNKILSMRVTTRDASSGISANHLSGNDGKLASNDTKKRYFYTCLNDMVISQICSRMGSYKDCEKKLQMTKTDNPENKFRDILGRLVELLKKEYESPQSISSQSNSSVPKANNSARNVARNVVAQAATAATTGWFGNLF